MICLEGKYKQNIRGQLNKIKSLVKSNKLLFGCFYHAPFNRTANKTVDSTFFKTKDNEVRDRRNHFVNHPSRYNTFCIIFLTLKKIGYFCPIKIF